MSAALVDGVWYVTYPGQSGPPEPVTCEMKVGGRGELRTCGKPALFRAITGASDLSGQNYDERLCCASCKAADEASGKYYRDGVLVEDYGASYEYEEITAEWLEDA